VKPPAAQSYFLLVDLHRIRQQWPDPCDAAPKGTKSSPGTRVAGYLLIEITTHSGRETERKMLVEGPLDMELIAPSRYCAN
jgi:hypothetical protein